MHPGSRVEEVDSLHHEAWTLVMRVMASAFTYSFIEALDEASVHTL